MRTLPGEVAPWFTRIRSAVGVGVVLGEVSGGLWVRDFDEADAYERWAEAHSDLAKSLPTVKTSRGFHVYGRWPSLVSRTLSDGELRADKLYVVAPPSPHPSGCTYTWLVPLPEGDVPEVDPVAAGLAPPSVLSDGGCHGEHRANGAIRDTERLERTETSRDRETEAICAASLLSRNDVRDAIRRTTPTGRSRRNTAIFALARALKAIPDLADLTAAALRPVVKAWHAVALPHIGTPEWATTWGDFVHGWKRVHTPEGADPLSHAMIAVEEHPPPAWSLEFGERPARLASLCRELQRHAGTRPFFLSCAKAGKCLGEDATTIYRWLAGFMEDGKLELVELGTQDTRRATRYRYVADDLNQATASIPSPPCIRSQAS